MTSGWYFCFSKANAKLQSLTESLLHYFDSINATLYYLSNTIHTSFLPYHESTDAVLSVGKDHELTAASAHKPYGHGSHLMHLRQWPRCFGLIIKVQDEW